MIRPRIPMIRKKPSTETQVNSYVFDSALEMNKVAEIVSDLERLKASFLNKINNLEKLTDETREKNNKNLEQLSNTFIKKALISLREDTQIVIHQYQNKIQEIEVEIERIKTIQKGDKGETGNNGNDGKDGISPDISLIIKSVIKLIPLPKDGKDAFVDEKALIDIIIKKLLEKGLEIKNIKNLEAELRHLSSKTMLGAKGGEGSWKQKQLSGTINGSNTVFTFAGDPPAEFSERIFLNYLEQNPFTDYTISGNTLTYTVAPDSSLSGLPHIIRYQ